MPVQSIFVNAAHKLDGSLGESNTLAVVFHLAKQGNQPAMALLKGLLKLGNPKNLSMAIEMRHKQSGFFCVSGAALEEDQVLRSLVFTHILWCERVQVSNKLLPKYQVCLKALLEFLGYQEPTAPGDPHADVQPLTDEHSAPFAAECVEGVLKYFGKLIENAKK